MFKFAQTDELVKMGQEGQEKLLQYLVDTQTAIGEEKEFHPDFMDAVSDAWEELGWDQDELIDFFALGMEIGDRV